MIAREMYWQALSRLVGRMARRVSSMNRARKVAKVTNAVTRRLSSQVAACSFQVGRRSGWRPKSKTEPDAAVNVTGSHAQVTIHDLIALDFWTISMTAHQDLSLRFD